MGVFFTCSLSVMSNQVLPHVWASASTMFHFRLFSRFIGPPSKRADRLSKLGHWKFGLRYQDLNVQTPTVERALDRLPLKERELRDRRIKRACVLWTANKAELPKEEWTKPEEDTDYLTPYILEIIEEDNDRATWRM